MILSTNKPAFSLIYASTSLNGIGLNNTLPWSLPADLKHFRQLTLGKTIVMGSKTYLSIGKPLPKRVNVVLSRKERPEGLDASVYWVGSVAEAVSVCEEQTIEAVKSDNITGAEMNEDDVTVTTRGVFVIGGGEVYRLMENMCDVVYHTLVKGEYECDTRFELQDDWQVAECRETEEADYRVLKRRSTTLTE